MTFEIKIEHLVELAGCNRERCRFIAVFRKTQPGQQCGVLSKPTWIRLMLLPNLERVFQGEWPATLHCKYSWVMAILVPARF